MVLPLASTLRGAAGRLAPLIEFLPTGLGAGTGLYGTLRQFMLTGAGVTGPFLVTFAVLGFVLNFVTGVLEPFVLVLEFLGVAAGASTAEKQVLVVLLVSAGVFLVGVLSETSPDTRVGSHLQTAVESIPGVGSVYTSFDRMSEVLLDDDAESFQEVKLVEFPQEDTYSLAFVTADGPASVETATDEPAVQVLFVPMAPNPVMGGFLVFVPTHRVIDVDMTVQEAFQALVTSGVAAGDPDGAVEAGAPPAVDAPADLSGATVGDLPVDPGEAGVGDLPVDPGEPAADDLPATPEGGEARAESQSR